MVLCFPRAGFPFCSVSAHFFVGPHCDPRTFFELHSASVHSEGGFATSLIGKAMERNSA